MSKDDLLFDGYQVGEDPNGGAIALALLAALILFTLPLIMMVIA